MIYTNIYINSFYGYSASFLKERVLPTITEQQKKIVFIGSIALSCVFTGYLIKDYYFKATLYGEVDLEDLPPDVEDEPLNLPHYHHLLDGLYQLSLQYLFQIKPYTSGDAILKELSEYESCKTLIDAAQKVIKEFGWEDLEVRFEPTTCGFDAETQENIIWIRPDLPASEQRNLFMFELTNMIQHEKIAEKFDNLSQGHYKSEEEFAQEIEFIEYNGLKRANAIYKNINEQKWCFFRPYISNSWKHIDSLEFNDYYDLVDEDHKDVYRKYWRDVNNFLQETA